VLALVQERGRQAGLYSNDAQRSGSMPAHPRDGLSASGRVSNPPGIAR
jgi:hypothetical protein